MSLPRRGSRIITVDGVRYRWVVTGQREPNCGIAVEDADAPAGLLLADADENTVIVPAMVAAGIRRARQAGWDPHAARPPFRLPTSLGLHDRAEQP